MTMMPNTPAVVATPREIPIGRQFGTHFCSGKPSRDVVGPATSVYVVKITNGRVEPSYKILSQMEKAELGERLNNMPVAVVGNARYPCIELDPKQTVAVVLNPFPAAFLNQHLE